MSAGRDQADVAAGLAASLVVGANGEQPGVLPLRTGIRLQRHRVVSGESGKPVLDVGDQLAQSRRVARGGGKRMLSGELGPGDRLHLGRRIELHRARAERNHAAVQGNVLVGQRPQVAHHLGLGAVSGERRMRQELRCPVGDIGRSNSSRPVRPEGRQHGVDVVGGGGLVAGHRHVVGVDQPDVDAARLGAVRIWAARPGTRASTVSKNAWCTTSTPAAARPVASVRAWPCTRRAIPGQPVGAVVAGVHRGDHRQQHLRGADVAGGLVPADVLLAGLQREPVGRGAVGVQRHPDQPAG